MILIFQASGVRPLAMYVSTHEAGALYLAPLQYPGQIWDFKGYEVRKGIKIGSPRFPKNAFNLSSGRPVLFAAKGSHGLWTFPGQFFIIRKFINSSKINTILIVSQASTNTSLSQCSRTRLE
jgi:hypothetical protein